jgi:aminoglycoside 3-N-acetyltransferase I
MRARAHPQPIQDVFVAADNQDVQALDFYRSLGGQPLPVTIFTFARNESFKQER